MEYIRRFFADYCWLGRDPLHVFEIKYEEEGEVEEGEEERQPVQTYKGHGYRHWPNFAPEVSQNGH